MGVNNEIGGVIPNGWITVATTQVMFKHHMQNLVEDHEGHFALATVQNELDGVAQVCAVGTHSAVGDFLFHQPQQEGGEKSLMAHDKLGRQAHLRSCGEGVGFRGCRRHDGLCGRGHCLFSVQGLGLWFYYGRSILKKGEDNYLVFSSYPR